MRRRLWTIPVVFLVVLAGCGSPGGSGAPSQSGAAELTPVTYGFSVHRTILHFPYFVALEMGYFEDEGLDVTFEFVSGGGAGMQQLVAGGLDVVNNNASVTLQAVDSGQDVVWYYTWTHQNLFTLVTPTDSGISQLEDLEGKVIGISEPSGGEVPFLRAMMGSVGLVDGEDYQMLAVGEGGSVTFEALRNGDVDAYISSIYDVSNMAAAGLELNHFLPDQFRYVPSLGDVVTRETFEQRSDILIGIGRAVAKGQLFAETNPEAAMAIAEKHQPEIFEDRELAQAWWDATQEIIPPPADSGVDQYGAHYIPGWESYIDVASQGTEEEGALQGPFDLDQIVGSSLIDEINDFDRDAVIADAEGYEP